MKRCAACGAELCRKRFSGRLEDRTAFSRRRYCNRSCMAAGMQKEKCSSPSHSRMKAHRHQKMRCELCELSHRNLHVHHKDEDSQNNEPENLMTLCPSCHALTHSQNYDPTTGRRKPCEFCSAPARQKGWCFTHLTRYKRFGHPLARKRKIGSEWRLMLQRGDSWSPFRSLATHGLGLEGCAPTATRSSRRSRKSS